jgi:5-(carboxyamino)imidazole ribonucleotide mutase
VRVSGPARDHLRARIVALTAAGLALTASALLLGSAIGLPVGASGAVAVVAIGGLAYRLFFEDERGATPAPAVAAPAATAPAANASAASRPAAATYRSATTTPREVTMAGTALVGIIMGSESDRPVMQECADTLDRLGVPFEMIVASAHRQPQAVHEWAASAAERGLRVIVAAAGKAAHLGGVVAAYTPLPVIAVPMRTSDLGGLDSLLSMVQMPSGVPVACVAINGAKNAAILATQILGASDGAYRDAIVALKSEMAEG